jgi:ketosteroid isomerase-like protein
MSRQTVEIVRQALSAWDGGELDQILELTHPEFVAEVPPEVSAEPDTYRGHDGIRRYIASFQHSMEDIRFNGERFWDAGESVVVELLLTARGRQTAIAVEQRTAGVWTVRDGRVVRIRAYATLADALAEVELAE